MRIIIEIHTGDGIVRAQMRRERTTESPIVCGLKYQQLGPVLISFYESWRCHLATLLATVVCQHLQREASWVTM